MRRTFLWAVGLMLVGLVARGAEPVAPKIDSVRLGFNGHYKVGFWTPVEIALAGGDAQQKVRVDVIVPDGDGVLSQVTSPEPVLLSASEQRLVLLYAKIGRPAGPITVALRGEDDRVLARRSFIAPEIPTALPATRETILTVGPPPDLAFAMTLHRQDEFTQTDIVSLDGVQQLPDQWFGYDGVDIVVMTTSKPELYRALTTAQLAALEQWVRLGGRLVWSAAREARTVLAESFPLFRFAPGKFEEMIPIRTGNLESYVVTADRLDRADGSNARFRLEAPRLSNVRGLIDVYDGARATDIPLVIREPRGLGEVVFAGLDIELAPIARWTGRGRLINQLLGFGDEGRVDESEVASRQGLHAGYEDLSGQLRGALDQFAGAPMIPFWIVGSLILLLLLAVGPVDYFLVKDLLRRMELTWITFPLWIIGFCALALWAAERFKGHETRINQIDLVDVDQSSRLIRGTTWFNIFSPNDASYDLTVDPTAVAPASSSNVAGNIQVITSWFGLPGTGLGGMNSETAAPPVEASPYRYSPSLDRVFGVPIRVWSTKPMMAIWNGTVAPDAPWLLGGQLTHDENGTLAGTVVNNLRSSAVATKPDVALEDCMLYYGRLAYSLGRIEPGQQVSVVEQTARTIEALVTRRHPVGDKDAATPYDPYDLNATRVLELMTLHDAVGGRKYTHLVNRYQNLLELSDELRLGRAVVVGRYAEPVAAVLNGDQKMSGPQDTRWTLFRFVLPVTERK